MASVVGSLCTAASAQPAIDIGACCLPDGTCVVAPEALCTAAGGTFQGVDTACENVTCTPAPPPTECACDWNDDGVLNSSDISAFITAWVAGNGDFNGDEVNNSADIVAFIVCYVRGC